MASKRQRNTEFDSTSKLIMIAIPLLIILSIVLYLDNKKMPAIIEEKQKEIDSFSEAEYKNKVSELQNKVDDIRNAKDKINTVKDNYYQDIRKYEDLVMADKGSKKIAYLTDDDTPSNNTGEVLIILEEKNALITFFTNGKPRISQDIYDKMVSDGHTIGNHTYSHGIFTGLYDSPTTFINDVEKQENFIKEKTGVTAKLFRFPGGSKGSSRVLKVREGCITKLHDSGYKYIDWNASTGDAGGNALTAQQVVDNAMNGARKYDITVILMHDMHSSTVEALPILIDTLRNEGYIILPLSEYSMMVH